MELLSYIAASILASTPINLGVIGDKASGLSTSTEYIEALPKDTEAIHRYYLRIEDKKGLGEILGDSFYARVRLESAPPGLQMCVRMFPGQPKRICDKTSYELKGSYGTNNSQDVTIWIFWHPQATPIVGNYKLVMSGV